MFILFEQKWQNVSFLTPNYLYFLDLYVLPFFRHVVILQQIAVDASKIHGTNIYVVDYPELNHKAIAVKEENLKARGFTLFAMRSNIYLAYFHQDTVTFYTFDPMSNNSLVYLQELRHPMISNFNDQDSLLNVALPF